MTTLAAFNFLERYRFKQSKKAQLFETFQKIQFNGQLVWSAPNCEKRWNFYFSQGRIMYATGGTHPVRRWARTLAAYCPQIQINLTQLQRELSKVNTESFVSSWEYQLFSFWLEQQRITQEQTEKVIQSVVEEVIFDLSKQDNLTHQIQESKSIVQPLVLINEQQVISNVQQLWQILWNAKIPVHALEQAPIIKHPKQLEERTSERVYQALNNLLNGENTLRDLTVKMKRDIVQVTRLLLPYIKSGIVDLISISDLPEPVYRKGLDIPSSRTNSTKPLIACVDDSVAVCQTLDKLLSAAGYQFVGINDGLRAVTSILACKPNLIFLDLMMPNTNGYEICSQLRKAPSFRDTPIIILTGNDGIVDQVRARLFGATDFLSKPVDAGKVLSTISTHLSQKAMSHRQGAN
jgi:chemotaxis family two-component system response regulator PixG